MSQENEVNNEVSVEDLNATLQEKDAMIKDLQSQFEAVKSKADQLLDETKKAKAKAREEAEAKEQAEIERARKAGDFEQLLQSSEKERKALAERLESIQAKVGAEKTRHEALRIAGELADGSNAELLSEFIVKRLRHTDDGVKVLDANGDLTVSSLDDLKREFESSGKFKALIRGNKSSGGGAAGDGGGASKPVEIKRTQFDDMTPEQKMSYVKKGGKIID